MSPIPSSTNAFALPTPTAVDNSGQPLPLGLQSQVLLGTGGLLVAVVAIVSIAAYFSRRRGTFKGVGKNHSWASGWNGLLSTLGRGSSDTTFNGATDYRAPVHIEAGVEHVNMVYATHFHPTCWSPVESHPPTPSAPAIYVEEEAQEPQVSEPHSFDMHSFPNIVDDEGDGSDNSTKRAPEEARQVERLVSKRPPPYDMSTSINVSFTIDVIGTTARRGTFLPVPGEPDEELSNEEASNFKPDFYCAPYDETLTLPPEVSCSLEQYRDASLDPEWDCYCAAYGGILVTQPCCMAKQFGREPSGSDLEFDLSHGAYDGIPLETLTSSSQVKSLLIYDVPPRTRISFRDRPLPAIPVQLEDPLSESSSFGSDSDFHCSPYAGIEIVEDHPVYDATPSMLSRQILTVTASDRARPLSIILEESEEDLSQSSWHDSDSGFSCSPYDRRSPKTSSSSFDVRQYGVVDPANSAENLSLASPEGMVTISSSPGLLNLSELIGADRALSCVLDQAGFVDEPACLSSDVGVQDGDNGFPDTSPHDTMPAAVRDAPEIMRSLLEELRDFELEFNSGTLSEDSDTDSEYSDCSDQDDADANAPDFVDSSGSDNSRRNLLESSSSTSEPDSEVSTEGSIYPPTPPLESAPNMDGTQKPSRGMLSAEEGDSSKSLSSPPSLPSKAYTRTRRDSRSLWYGPRIPLVALPRL